MMEKKTFNRIMKDFPFLWAINNEWEIYYCLINVEYVNELLIQKILHQPPYKNREFWAKCNVEEKTDSPKEIVRKLSPTPTESQSIAQTLFFLPADYKIDYLIRVIKEESSLRVVPENYDIDMHHRYNSPGILTQITIFRPPKNKSFAEIMHNLKEGKIKW